MEDSRRHRVCITHGNTSSTVLILILVEDSRRLYSSLLVRRLLVVLILILVEDSRRPEFSLSMGVELPVLILILVEDSRRRLVLQTHVGETFSLNPYSSGR